MDLIINPIHSVIFFVSFCGIVISLILFYYDRKNWGSVIGPFSYFLNVFVYNLFLHLKYVAGIDLISYNGLIFWSGVVRLHSLFLFMSYILVRPLRIQRQKKEVKDERDI